MSEGELRQLWKKLRALPGGYPLRAYVFTLESLASTVNTLEVKGHVNGRELATGMQMLARAKYGVLARNVLSTWNINTTHDFGQIVYNLIQVGMMRRSDSDSIDDFDQVYDFDDAFSAADYDYLANLSESGACPEAC